MGQCQGIKKDGTQCKGKAIEGADFCAAHLKQALAGEVTALPTDPAAGASSASDNTSKEKTVPAAIHDKLHPKKIRFIGNGRYAIPSEGVVFLKPGQIEEVSHKCWERLLTNPESRAVFEEV